MRYGSVKHLTKGPYWILATCTNGNNIRTDTPRDEQYWNSIWEKGAGIVYRNICAKYGLKVPGSKGKTSSKVIENNQAKIPWDFQIETDKMVVVNQPHIIVVDKQEKKVVVVNVAIQSDSNIRKKEQKKLEKYQGLKEELERMQGVKALMVPVLIGAHRAVTHKLGDWIQQTQDITSEISVQKTTILGTA